MLHRLFIRPLLELGHLMAAAVIGTVIFTVAVTGLATAAGLLPVFLLGLPVFVATVVVVHAIAVVAVGLTRRALEVPIDVRPTPRATRPGFIAGPLELARRPEVWREQAYALLLFVVGLVGFVVVFCLWSAALAGLLLPAYITWLPGDGITWFKASLPREALVGVAAGLLLAVVARVASTGFTQALVALSRGLMSAGETERLRGRVAHLQDSRSRMVDAADAERRRIERDLHDGAQQHLVNLAMTLGRARQKLEDDPEAARELVDRAHAEAKDSIVALREVVRGVHPAVLTDRGLDAALSAVAARSPLRTRLRVDLPVRPTPTVEAVAYFVAAEALTNATRHSGARNVDVAVERRGDELLLVVADDGRGGARATPGGGLAGLRDRVTAVDGSLTITSPPDGGTTVTVRIPCAF